MFGGAAVVVAPMLVYMYLASDIMSVEAFTGLFGALLAVISLLLYWYLMKGGNRAFKEL
jgi:hypothetical protein